MLQHMYAIPIVIIGDIIFLSPYALFHNLLETARSSHCEVHSPVFLSLCAASVLHFVNKTLLNAMRYKTSMEFKKDFFQTSC